MERDDCFASLHAGRYSRDEISTRPSCTPRKSGPWAARRVAQSGPQAFRGVLTGDWDGPHISPIATYDVDLRHVLIMDVDRQWYIPYWSSDEKLLAAMLRPAPANMGVLAGQTGGLVRVRLKTAR